MCDRWCRQAGTTAAKRAASCFGIPRQTPDSHPVIINGIKLQYFNRAVSASHLDIQKENGPLAGTGTGTNFF